MQKNLFKLTMQASVFFFLCQSINAQSFILNGTFNGKDSGYAILRYFRDGIKKRQSDTVTIRQGKFQFTGTVTGADYAFLDSDMGYSAQLFIEPGVINIVFDNDEKKKPVISGSRNQKEYELLKNYTSKEDQELRRISKSYTSIDSLLKNGLINPKTAEEKRKEVDKIYGPLFKTKANKELTYIRRHPNSYVSLILLYYFVGYMPNDSIDVLYSVISDSVKNSTLDYSFLAYNSGVRKALSDEYPFDKLKMNEEAPSFTIYNVLTNDSMMLSDFRGKLVVLEFWGLYCFPCLKSNPHLESIRKQYGKDRLEIIAINNNQARDMPELSSYINKNKLSDWIHVFTNDEFKPKNKLFFKGDFKNYSGLGVPRTVLIDKKGMVIYKHYDYSEEEMNNLRSLIDKIVNESAKNDF